MRHKLSILLLLAVVMGCPLIARATDLRGRVDGVNPYTGFRGPYPGIRIGLFIAVPGQNFTLVREAVTGPDGFYYLRGVYPGQYILQVGGVNFPLGVVNAQTQDIPPIQR
jgi:hypothetical protein